MGKEDFGSEKIWPNDNIAEIATYMGSHSLLNYANGFLEVARIVAEQARKNQCPVDSVMPAVLYNIRHSVELFVKSIISEAADSCGQSTNATGHKIQEMFDEHKTLITCYLEAEGLTVPFPYEQWLKDFEEIIAFVSAFDCDGQTARYPTNLKGKPNWNGKAIVSTSDVCCLIVYIQSYYDKYINRGA